MKPASAVEPAPGCPPALHYVSDDSPGYSRRILNDKPAYFDQQGKRIRDPETIRRINALAIPPAYRDVWICPPAARWLWQPLGQALPQGCQSQPAGSGGYGEGCGKAPGQHALGLSQMLYPSRDSGCLPGGGAGSGEMEHRSGQTPLAQARRGGPVKLSAALQRGRQTQGIRPGSSWRSSISWYSPGG